MIIECNNEFFQSTLQHVQIEITGCCNMKCQHCRAVNEVKKMLPISQIEKVFKVIERTRDEDFRLTISGGEPFLNPHLIDILKMAKNYNINSIIITTNASLVTEELLKEIDKIKFDFLCIQISLDSLNRNIHDKFRGSNGAFDKCIKVIDDIKKYENIYSSIRMTVTPSTLNEVDNMIDFALEQGVKIIGIGSVIPFGNAKDGRLSLSPLEKKKFLEILAKRHVELDGKIDVTSEDPLKFLVDKSPWNYCGDSFVIDECFFGGCTAGVTTFNVSSDGTITPCAMLEEKILNINDYDDINKLIEDYCNSEIVRNLFSRNFAGPCGTCKNNRICGGCRAVAKGFTNDYMGSDLSCWRCTNENI